MSSSAGYAFSCKRYCQCKLYYSTHVWFTSPLTYCSHCKQQDLTKFDRENSFQKWLQNKIASPVMCNTILYFSTVSMICTLYSILWRGWFVILQSMFRRMTTITHWFMDWKNDGWFTMLSLKHAKCWLGTLLSVTCKQQLFLLHLDMVISCNIYTFQSDTQCSCTDCLLILRCQLYMFRTVTVHPQEHLCRYCMCRLWYVLIRPAGTTFYQQDVSAHTIVSTYSI